jgi:hypothetical protein
VTYPSLEHIAMQARPYPAHLLEGCETGLVLFAAAFLGHNDAIHFAEAEIEEVWCVDIDAMRLDEMCPLYPAHWSFRHADAWEYARIHSEVGSQYDVVSADTFTGPAMRRSLDSLDLWCSLARKVVTVTYTSGEAYEVPEGWRESLYERATNVYWLVLERA